MRISYLEFRRVLFRSWRTGPTSARLAGNAAISLDHLLQIATQAGWIEPGTVQRQRRAIRLHQYGADTVRRGRAEAGQPAVDVLTELPVVSHAVVGVVHRVRAQVEQQQGRSIGRASGWERVCQCVLI